MMMRRLLALVGLILVPACLPIPQAHLPLALPVPGYRMAPDAVGADYLAVPGADEPHTPARFNRSYVLRLRADEPPRAVLVLVPGLFGGAGSLEILGRQLVAATPGLQVWLVDRRSNALEDHRGFDAARASRDPEIALRYYLGGDGQPASFEPPATDTVRFMAYWGLQVQLQDLGRIVDRAHLDAPLVYLGGHSLGASLAALYTAYVRADGRPGAEGLAGLLLLDGAPGRTGAFDLPDAVEGRRLAGYNVVPSVAELESGRAAPYLGPGLVPQRVVRSAVIATFARYRPDELAPAALSDIRVTNLALAGITADDTYAELPSFAPSLGEATDAETSGYLLPFLLEGTAGARSRSVVGVAPGADRVGWSAGDPPEATDLMSYVRSVTGPSTDRAEWYFPVRLLIDMAVLPIDLHGTPGFVSMSSVRVPTLAIGAGRGMIRDTEGFSAYANARLGSSFTRYVVPGVTHIDLITARAAPVVPIVQSWTGLGGSGP
ncbi:MAG: hypothetical protein P8Y02_05820 [Deinococcales bacterium]